MTLDERAPAATVAGVAAAAGAATTAPKAPAAPAQAEPGGAGQPAAPVPLKLAGDVIEGPLREFLERAHASGEPVTIEIKKTSFTGHIFRMLLKEGWIALEHADGRRRAFILIEGGTIRSRSGEELALPGGAGH